MHTEDGVLALGVLKCAESIDTVYPLGIQATLYKGEAIMVVQKQIWPTNENGISGPRPVILVTLWGVQSTLGNTENA